MQIGQGFTIRLGGAVVIYDVVGFLAQWRGRGIAWTREFGWVRD